MLPNTAFADDMSWPSAGIRPAVFKAAMAAYRAHSPYVTNDHVMAIIDYGLPSSTPRLFVLERDTGRVMSYLVAHGVGSDPDHTGVARNFANTKDSRASSLGAYVTESPYTGQHGLSLRLKGLDPTNDNAEARAIVLHGAEYVQPGAPVIGRSWGCPAVEPSVATRLVEELRGGSLLFASN
ncbi:MAG: murein L,D-transpeptidase catalytic domain family protein [Alphaproteobacteria bacterium]